MRGRRDPGLYLSFVNLSFVGDEGDVFGNLLAILCGLTGHTRAQQIIKTLRAARAADPYPVRVMLRPITRSDALWRAYMERHQQNHPHQYHNGGIWPFVGGFWVAALALLRRTDFARSELAAARAHQPPRRLALHRMVPRRHARTDGHGRTKLERGDLPARAARGRRRHRGVLSALAAVDPSSANWPHAQSR